MLSILQVNSADRGGGAEGIARGLHELYRARGHDAWLAVGRQATRDPGVVHIDQDRFRSGPSRVLLDWAARLHSANRQGVRGAGRLARRLVQMAQPVREWRRARGFEDFAFPASRHLLNLTPSSPHLVHGHNLHGDYFDLRILPGLSRRMPVFMTLHDGWLLSGHCAHGMECGRWRTGCGECPDLDRYPPVRRDGTERNWQRKARIYAQSRLHVATPCRWMMEQVDASMLQPAIASRRVIPNGIDLTVFHPGSRDEARRELGLDPTSTILLFAARDARSNGYKDYACMREAVERVAAAAGSPGRLLFLAVGDATRREELPGAELRFIPFQDSAHQMARYYRAADLYLHAAKQDTFPNTILEAMACGTPVVATAVGGIPEQVRDGVSGHLVRRGDAEAMASRIAGLLRDPDGSRAMGRAAVALAVERFGVERMANDYIAWYEETVTAGI